MNQKDLTDFLVKAIHAAKLKSTRAVDEPDKNLRGGVILLQDEITALLKETFEDFDEWEFTRKCSMAPYPIWEGTSLVEYRFMRPS
jgi:hypothetical protein